MSAPKRGLEAASRMGPFFVVEAGADAPGWRPLAELVEDRRLLGERVAATREALASSAGVSADALPEKAAASIMQLGLVARLLSPALASAVLSGSVPDLALDQVWWQPRTANPFPLAIPHPRGTVAGSLTEIAEAMSTLVVENAMRPLVVATAELVRVSPKILWGNVASGLGGAAAVIGTSRTDLAERAREIVTAVLADGPLRGAGGYAAGGHFRRQSCCLFYRVPGAGLCGDCILVGV